MDFDFYEIYKDFSTTELLKIVHRPDEFQPGAVEAANRRLSERAIAQDDRIAAHAFYEERDHDARLRAEKIDQIKGQAADLLQPILQPSPNVTPHKWLNMFLLVLGLQYSWTMVQTLIAVYKSVVLVLFGAGFGVHERVGYENAASHLLDFNFLINIITLIYLPLFFYLLYRRKSWGWILVFAGILIGILGVPMQVYSYSRYLRAMGVGRMDITTMAWFVIQSLLRIAFAWFLWKQDICDLFGVDKSTKTRTVLYTSVITLVVFGALWFLF